MGKEEGRKTSYQLSFLKSYLTVCHLQALIRLHVSQGLVLGDQTEGQEHLFGLLHFAEENMTESKRKLKRNLRTAP